MKRILSLSDEQKYSLALVLLMGTASAVSLMIFGARVQKTDNLQYRFLLWNLFLAWIPLGMAWLASNARNLRRPLKIIIILICSVLWLAFLPNAPYIMTDFQHLARMQKTAPLWYDVLMLAWFAWNGLFLGIISLFLMQQVVASLFSRLISWAFVVIVSGLSSFGIYLGRFLRWNSWDILHNPAPLAADIYERIVTPQSDPRAMAFTFLFSLFFLFVYLVMVTFAGLVTAKKESR
jgi:uncharacterized membrane protein